MALPRTFVGFSSTDIDSFRLMLAWKAHEHIDFNFTNCQLASEVDSENEAYIKRRCRERIDMAGTFAVLIGKDTASKHKYVRWEIETAIEKQCRLVAINLDGSRRVTDSCPVALKGKGAIFVPYSAKIIAHALDTKNWGGASSQDWHFEDHVYQRLGYKSNA
jgi:hypothetical protein